MESLREVEFEEAEAMCQYMPEILFVLEASAKDNSNIEEAFLCLATELKVGSHISFYYYCHIVDYNMEHSVLRSPAPFAVELNLEFSSLQFVKNGHILYIVPQVTCIIVGSIRLYIFFVCSSLGCSSHKV